MNRLIDDDALDGEIVETTAAPGSVSLAFTDRHGHPIAFEMTPGAARRIAIMLVRASAHADLMIKDAGATRQGPCN